jgi:hypothetical protein
MVTSALVVTIDGDACMRRAAMDALTSDARLMLGELAGARLPVVAETSGLGTAERLVEELSAIPGVMFVDVVLVDFDPSSDVDEAPSLGGHRRSHVEEKHESS